MPYSTDFRADGAPWRQVKMSLPSRSMGPTRIFLDDSSPAIPSAVDYLLTRYTTGSGSIDLQQVVIVVPAARAARRLREQFVTEAETRQTEFWAPQIITVRRLPELLYEPRLQLASTMVQNVAWADALKTVDSFIVRRIIPHAPTKDDLPWRDADWLDYGSLLCSQYRSLAAEGLTFSDVAYHTSRMAIGEESKRWDALATVQQRYLAQLDAAELWDRQTARVVAVRNQEIGTDSDIVLLGAVDLNRIVRDMLHQVPSRVTTLVHAPTAWKDRFDELGCLVPDAWEGTHLNIPDSAIVHVDGPEEQAIAVGEILHAYNASYNVDEITIGVPEPELIPFVQRELATRNTRTHWNGSQAIRESEPFLLLGAVARYLETASAEAVAALVRHPRIAEQVAGRIDQNRNWLIKLDKAYESHLPTRLFAESSDCQTSKILQQLSHLIPKICGELTDPEKRLPEWGSPIEDFLLSCYESVSFDRDTAIDNSNFETAASLQQSCADMSRMPFAMAPTVTAAEAIRYVLSDVEMQSTSSHPALDEIELLGWLDLPLDDAPATVITSFHEQFLPQSISSDLFLPNSLREQLGIGDNRQRYARDAYALCSILRSRKDLRLIVARRNAAGDPELPSRLLFAEDNETIVNRCLRFFGEGSRRETVFDRLLNGSADNAAFATSPGFAPPHPDSLVHPPIERLTPTAFRDYIACPYRFFLRHVLGIKTISEDLTQMDGRAFGNLAHEVLEVFGRNIALRDCSDAKIIFAYLREALDRQVVAQFGASPPPAVRIQVESLRMRLEVFARHQADRVKEGWRIQFVEEKVSVLLPEVEIPIRGIIDRIDVNDRGDWAVFDYKTGDGGGLPEAAHQTKRGGEWIDLQLPIYRNLAHRLAAQPQAPTFSGRIELGYVVLPSDLKKVGFARAGWTDADLQTADDRTVEIIQQIQSKVFWPPTAPPPKFSEWAAAICLDNVAERRANAPAV